jgi:hypothetical protein
MSFLWTLTNAVDDDVRMDQGIHPMAELPCVTCPKCGIDTTDFTQSEWSAHRKYHRIKDTPCPEFSNRQAELVTAIQQQWAEQAADRREAGMWGF